MSSEPTSRMVEIHNRNGTVISVRDDLVDRAVICQGCHGECWWSTSSRDPWDGTEAVYVRPCYICGGRGFEMLPREMYDDL